MGVEARHHAGDGIGDELLVVDRFDVVGLDQTEYRRELLDFFQGKRGHGATGHGLQGYRGQCAGKNARGDPSSNFEFLAHKTPLPLQYTPDRCLPHAVDRGSLETPAHDAPMLYCAVLFNAVPDV
ncbi:hypothetical protein D3C71_1687200 [compost metagenome]